jgi:hypothetical protein
MPRRPQYEMNLAMFDDEEYTFIKMPGHSKTLLLSRTAVDARASLNLADSWVVPCCKKLMLMFYNASEEEKEQEVPDVHGKTYGNLKEALWGTVKVTLEERSGLEGNQWMVAHHDVNLVGSLPPFPRGVRVRGDQIEKTLVLFKPRHTTTPPYGVDSSARAYRLYLAGSIQGVPIYGYVNLRFEHHGDNGLHQTPNDTVNCQGVAAMGRGRFLYEIRDLSHALYGLNGPLNDIIYDVANEDASGRQRMELRNNIWRHVF